MKFNTFKNAFLGATVVLAAWATPAAATPFPGPDGGGYSGSNIGFNLRNASGGTLAFGNGYVDDSVTAGISIGFSFSFYGVSYTEAFIGSNGFITFSAEQSQGCCEGLPLPSTFSPNNLVAGWWVDLTSDAGGGNGEIRYQTTGAAGSQEFVVEYIDNPYWLGDPGVTNTFEIILHEGSNDIELQYLVTGADSRIRSVGIENAGGTLGLQFLNDNTSLLNQQGICISTGTTNCGSDRTVPEPEGMALFGIALAGLLFSRRRRQ